MKDISIKHKIWIETDDKAGGNLNLLRWVSPRTIKETFIPAQDFSYPFMEK